MVNSIGNYAFFKRCKLGITRFIHLFENSQKWEKIIIKDGCVLSNMSNINKHPTSGRSVLGSEGTEILLYFKLC